MMNASVITLFEGYTFCFRAIYTYVRVAYFLCNNKTFLLWVYSFGTKMP